MHPRNIYRQPPSFKDLAIAYPEFRKYVKISLSGKVKFEFQSPNALCELTKTLLLKDFNLIVDIPVTNLIPTLPLRLNYILWIEDLLHVLGALKDVTISGIDIGTGASCIYPLLAAKMGWTMLATEIDTTSIAVAEKNVETNSLSNLITIKKVPDCKQVLKGVIDEDKVYHFCMCNPPFFTISEVPENRTKHRTSPKNAPSGISTEIETDGGEVSFISKIIEDSTQLKENILIFTTMVGKRSNFKVLKSKIEAFDDVSITTTEFHQGRTTRWGLAWSFKKELPKNDVNKKVKDKDKTPLVFELPEGTVLITSIAKIQLLLSQLKMSLKEIGSEPWRCHVTAIENTWTNQRKKRRQMLRQTDDQSPPSKKPKTEDCPSASKASILEFELKVSQPKSVVTIEALWKSGPTGKDGVHQVIQYLKNNWNTRISDADK